MNRSTLIATLVALASVTAVGCAASPPQHDAPTARRTCAPRATAAETYMLAWNTADRDVRRCLVTAVWSPHGRYVDPTADVTGVDALVDHIGGYLQQFPGTRLEPTGPVITHHEFIHFPWRVVAGSQTVLEGKDFGRLDGEGKLVLIAGFFGPVAPAR
jgi:hypothetical protein